MRHSFLDQYSNLDSPVRRLDPRTKFLLALFFIVAVVLTPVGGWLVLGAYFSILAAVFAISRLPLNYVLKRSAIILPFVLLLGVINLFTRPGAEIFGLDMGSWHFGVTDSGLLFVGTLLLRSWLAVLALILLSSTTPLPNLLKGLEKLKLPKIMVMILSFMYRYLFLLIDEVLRMKQARDSRTVGAMSNSFQAKTVGAMIGTLFIRSYERGERVYAAMVARGFDGSSRTLNELAFSRNDAVAVLIVGMLILLPSMTRLILA